MHFEILVEDQSGKRFLETMIPKIIHENQTFRVHPYKGIGHIPKNMKPKTDPRKRILLDRLPHLIQGYGNTFAEYPDDYPAILVIVCDLDNKCMKKFRNELLDVLAQCEPKPNTHFCLAIEEMEAWLLGDLDAIKKAYPNAKVPILNGYKNDSICNTWEILADAIYPGGQQKLSGEGWVAIGTKKTEWAVKISNYMEPQMNKSPSFNYFVQCIQSQGVE